MNKPKVTVLIQARMGSTRLPGKVLNKILGKEILLHMLERVRRTKTVDEVVVIMPTNQNDDILADLCARNNISYYRGSEFDLLDRHYQATIKFKSGIVSKIPSDCPLIDPHVIDEVIGFYLNNQDKYDYVSNLHPLTYPDGLDVEVCPIRILKMVWEEAKKGYEREHTFPYIWDNPEKFRIGNVEMAGGKDFSNTERWVLDYAEDYEFIKKVYEELYDENKMFYMEDILDLLERKPEIRDINKHLAGVSWYRNHLGDLKTIDKRSVKFPPGGK